MTRTRWIPTLAMLGVLSLALWPRASVAQAFGPWVPIQSKTHCGRAFCAIASATGNDTVIRSVFKKVLLNEKRIVVNPLDVAWDRSKGSEIDVAIDFADDNPLVLPAYSATRLN